MIGYFQSVGNAYANTIWEELLTSDFRDTEDIRDKFVFNYTCLFNVFFLFFFFTFLHFSLSICVRHI